MSSVIHLHKRDSGEYITSIEKIDIKKATINDIKDKFWETHSYYPERQAWYIKDANQKQKMIVGDMKLGELPLTAEKELVLYFKDLGMQVSYRLVFVIEYLGPLLIFPLFYAIRSIIYPNIEGEVPDLTLTQKLGFAMVVFHFIKRELESLFIHRFSNATMPVLRLPINCSHYWILCGTNIAYYLFHPRYSAPFEDNLPVIGALLLTFFFSEMMNLATHVHLRNLRPRGSKERKIPYGYGFDITSCANYTWEILAWLSFCILTNTLVGWFFLLVATGQMTEWALKKHKQYKNQFPNYPKNRKAIIPFIL